ncbi:MAG: hypothetical protein NTY24_13325 [Mycobacterium sp.]|nr:hypothetical protein [Mycobacterium sp.]MCX6481319.1 hypothetical protein [Mycobacterium sp.]
MEPAAGVADRATPRPLVPAPAAGLESPALVVDVAEVSSPVSAVAIPAVCGAARIRPKANTAALVLAAFWLN